MAIEQLIKTTFSKVFNKFIYEEMVVGKLAHTELKKASKETIVDIITKAKNNEFNIEQYLENNKVRVNAYSSLIPSNISLTDTPQMNNIYENLEKFKDNILEYEQYLKFLPIFNLFKSEFESLLSTESKDYKELNHVKESIEQKEKELEKINKKIFGGKIPFFEIKNENKIKQLKTESIVKTKELYELYKAYDEKYFYSKVLSNLNKNITISDVLHLYYSFDYFKK